MIFLCSEMCGFKLECLNFRIVGGQIDGCQKALGPVDRNSSRSLAAGNESKLKERTYRILDLITGYFKDTSTRQRLVLRYEF